VRLSAPVGPVGLPLYDASVPPARLVDVRAEGWCGRGFDAREGRLSVAIDGTIVRLY